MWNETNNHEGINSGSSTTLIDSCTDNVTGTDIIYTYNDEGSSAEIQQQRGDNEVVAANKASTLSSVINLLNTVAGAGMLGLPGAYAGSGFLVGTLLLMIAAFFSALGLHLLSVCAATAKARSRDNKPASFYTVAISAMPQFAIAIDAAVALKCFGVATGYFVTVADCMVDSFRYIFRNFSAGDESPAEEIEKMVFTNRQFWVTCALLSVIPISFFKTLDALKFTSMLALILIYSLAIGIILFAQGVFDPCENNSNLQYYQEGEYGPRADACQGETQMVTSFDGAVKNLAIFVFSFTCHQNVFAITNELRRPTQSRVDTVIFLAIGSALVLYLAVAIEGYRTYGTEVKGDILLNYPQNMLVTAMRIGIAIMVIFSYPLQLDPSRNCMKSLIYVLIGKSGRSRRERHVLIQGDSPNQEEDELAEHMLERLADVPSSPVMETSEPLVHNDLEENMNQLLDDFLFYGITCVFLVLSFIIAMSVSDLGVILGIVGATGSTMVSYILPGAIYMKMHPEPHLLRYLACIQFTVGMIIVPTALYFVVFKGSGGG